MYVKDSGYRNKIRYVEYFAEGSALLSAKSKKKHDCTLDCKIMTTMTTSEFFNSQCYLQCFVVLKMCDKLMYDKYDNYDISVRQYFLYLL